MIDRFLEAGHGKEDKNASSAVEPFQFMTEAGVVLWTGYIADDLPTLLRGLRRVPGSSIYYHVHHAVFRRPKYTWAEYTNDFAHWAFRALGQKGLAEKLSSVDPLKCGPADRCRQELLQLIQTYVPEDAVFSRVREREVFYFLEAKRYVFPMGFQACSVQELAAGVERFGADSVIYHFIEARFSNGERHNDFSRWLRLCGEDEKAAELDRLNPYYYDTQGLGAQIVDILRS